MDTFFEQIIVRKNTSVEKLIKILTIVLGSLAVVLMLLLSFFRALGSLSFLLVPLAFGCAVLIYFTVKNMYIEYEYSITNGSFDIDRIKGKSKRERMVSLECSNFEEFGIYNESAKNSLQNREFGGKVFAANKDSDNLFYAVVRHSKIGTVFIVIEPDDRVKSALKKFVPRQVQGDVLGGYGHSQNIEN